MAKWVATSDSVYQNIERAVVVQLNDVDASVIVKVVRGGKLVSTQFTHAATREKLVTLTKAGIPWVRTDQAGQFISVDRLDEILFKPAGGGRPEAAELFLREAADAPAPLAQITEPAAIAALRKYLA